MVTRFLVFSICWLVIVIPIDPTLAAKEPSWPKQCLDLHLEAVGSAIVKRYRVRFDNKPAGYETFCIVATDEGKTVFQWTSNAIHKFLGSTSIKHCRKEEWQRVGTDTTELRRRMQLREMQSWTDVGTDGTHSIASFLDQVPKPSSIRAIRRPDGSYRYILLDFLSGNEKKEWSVRRAALRTPWTELMIPTASVDMMDPVRYRISAETSVFENKPDPSVEIPHRRYRIDGGDFEFTAAFRADDGTLLEMDGKDASADVGIILIEPDSNSLTCPDPRTSK